MSAGFDPRQHLRTLKSKQGGSSEYLDVRWRLVWFRSEHPDGVIATELVTHDLEQGFALFRASVSIPDGGSAVDYGSETRADFKDYVEKASTKALGRALAALGYGTQFANDFDTQEHAPLSDSPVERPPSRPATPVSVPAMPDGQEADWLAAIEAAVSVQEAATLANDLRKQYPKDSRVVQAAVKRLAQLKGMPG